MSQFPHDRLNKNLFELWLSPFGEIKTQRPMDSETTFIDIYFVPSKSIPPAAHLGLLAQCVGNQAVAFEPYRNPVKIDEIRGCIIKALEIQQEVCPESPSYATFKPRMWIITPTLAKHKLTKVGAVEAEAVWGKGIYLLPEALQTGIIIIHQLPVIPETRWFRLMGKGTVQRAAMAEVAALPVGHLDRDNILDLLISYTIELAAKQNVTPENQELVMQLSPLYLERLEEARLQGLTEGEQLGELKGYQDFVLRQLDRHIGKLSIDLEAQIRKLPLEQLELLGDEISSFNRMTDLLTWVQRNS